jgi:hypothetical protein
MAGPTDSRAGAPPSVPGLRSVLVVGVLSLALASIGGAIGAPAAAAKAPKVTVTLGEVTNESAAGSAQLDPGQAQQVVASVRRYVNAASVKPLRTGKPAGDLSAVFGAAALARLTGPDRAVLVDEGLPKVTKQLRAVADPVRLSALFDRGGLVAVSADLALTVRGRARSGKLKIVRQGQFLFEPDGDAMKVVAFDMKVDRSGKAVDRIAPSTETTR